MEKGFYYLAAPHQGTLEEEAYRHEKSLKITAAFIKQGVAVFSPIVYSVSIAKGLSFSSVEERRLVMLDYLLNFLKAAKGMILVTMEGWEKSSGVNLELIFCQENQIPVYLMSPHQPTEDLAQIILNPLDKEQVAQLLRAA